MKNSELLDSLILEGDELQQTIVYVPAAEGVWRRCPIYRATTAEKYQTWQSSVQRFIKSFYPSDLEEFKVATEKINPDSHINILGLLNAIKRLPEEPDSNFLKQKSATNITINNSQHNTQSIVFNLIIDAIKDEITGKELKELNELLKEYEKVPQKDKSKIIDKVKNFGTDVLSNIIANILTNPNIYSGLI